MGLFFGNKNKSTSSKRTDRAMVGKVIFEVQLPRKYDKEEYYEDYAILNVRKAQPKVDKIFQDFVIDYPDYSLVLDYYDVLVDTFFICYKIYTDQVNKNSEDIKKMFVDYMKFKDEWNKKSRERGEDVFLLRGMQLDLIDLHVHGRYSDLNNKNDPSMLMRRLGA